MLSHLAQDRNLSVMISLERFICYRHARNQIAFGVYSRPPGRQRPSASFAPRRAFSSPLGTKFQPNSRQRDMDRWIASGIFRVSIDGQKQTYAHRSPDNLRDAA